MRPLPRPLASLALSAAIALTSALPLARAHAQSLTADDVINRYITRVGGMERISAVNSMRRTGKYIGGGGFEARIVQENSRPNKVREEFTLQGMTAINAWDGTTGWKIDPFGGKKDPEPLSEDEMHGILLDADFDEPLINYAAKGHKVQLVGMDQIEGTDVYKLRVAMANGDTRLYYMDKDSFVPIRMEETRVIRGAEQQFETNMGDYKPVAGWLVPFAYEVGRKGQDKASITYEKIEANPVVAPSRYAKPGAPSAGTTPGAGADGGEAITAAAVGGTRIGSVSVFRAWAVEGTRMTRIASSSLRLRRARVVEGTRMTRISPCPITSSDAPNDMRTVTTATATTTTATTTATEVLAMAVPIDATLPKLVVESASSASSAFITPTAPAHRNPELREERFASFAFITPSAPAHRNPDLRNERFASSAFHSTSDVTNATTKHGRNV